MRDPQRAERAFELLRRTSVPVGRVLEPVRVEVVRPGQVAVGVLLRHPEVDVEEEESIPVVAFRTPAGDELVEPIGVDQPVVARQPLHRQALVRGPVRPSGFEDQDRVSACFEPERERPRVPRVVPVNDDRAALANPLLIDLALNLRLVEAVQPRVGERHRAGHVAAAALVVESPAVVRRGGADVDDRHVRLVEEPAEISPVDGAQPVRLALMNAHWFVVPVLTVGLQKNKSPCRAGVQ